MSGESEGSDEDESSEVTKQSETQDLYIMPADDGAVTDEDCGEEDHVDISNLPSTQLTAFASIKSSQLQDDTDIGVMKQEKQKKIKLRQWKAEDLPEKVNVTRYYYKPSVADIPRKPYLNFSWMW